VPGPGNYDVKILSKNGISFGKSTRDDLKKDEKPGPGAYRVPVKFADVPKYLI